MEKLMEILTGIRPDLDFVNQQKLVDDKLLDSFEIVSIIAEINENFNISINESDLQPENFNSVYAMWKLVEQYL